MDGILNWAAKGAQASKVKIAMAPHKAKLSILFQQGYTAIQIADKLNLEGPAYPTGRRWTIDLVKHVFKLLDIDTRGGKW